MPFALSPSVEIVPVFVTQPSISDHATAFVVVGVLFLLLGLGLDFMAARREAFWWHLVGLRLWAP